MHLLAGRCSSCAADTQCVCRRGDRWLVAGALLLAVVSVHKVNAGSQAASRPGFSAACILGCTQLYLQLWPAGVPQPLQPVPAGVSALVPGNFQLSPRASCCQEPRLNKGKQAVLCLAADE